MRYRFAKLSDLKSIVNLHYSVREDYNVGVFASLDKNFLKGYYKMLLTDVNSIIVCAEDNSKILGFCSASLDVNDQHENFKKKKLNIALYAFTSVLKKPSLIKKLLLRYKSIKDDNINFISKSGARLEYWVWSKKNEDFVSSLYMHETLLNILQALGIMEVNFEVDHINKKVLKFHKRNGGIEIEKITISDNRERILMKYDFNNRVTKFNFN